MSPAAAQRRDVGGTWELTEAPKPPSFERARVPGETESPCDARDAQIRLLQLFFAEPRREFTIKPGDPTLVMTSGTGSLETYYTDGRAGKLTFGTLEFGASARWNADGSLTIEWTPSFGGSIVETYTADAAQSLLRIDQTIEHTALSRAVRQNFTYRRVAERPAPTPAGVNPTPAAVGQIADTDFRPPIDRPAYDTGTGPVVLIDEAHDNFHTATGRYLPFAELLRRDGYVVKSSPEAVTKDTLRGASVLVTANARRPFTAGEVATVHDWVSGGGALFLIVDHPPFVEPSGELAKAFQVRLRNEGAVDLAIPNGRLIFRRANGTLKDHAVTQGIDEVVTFTGSSFQIETGQPLLVFGPQVCSGGLDPNPSALQGNLQGAVLRSGAGKVAVFAEAAMFSAQVSGPSRAPMGMNVPIARQNAQLLLNLLHWLSEGRRSS